MGEISAPEALRGFSALGDEKPKRLQMVMAYHPDCKSCKEFAEDYERLAARFKQRLSNVDFLAVNFSNNDIAGMKIEAFPTFRLYSGKKRYVEYSRNDLKLGKMKKWLKQNGAELGHTDPAEEKEDAKEENKEVAKIIKDSK